MPKIEAWRASLICIMYLFSFQFLYPSTTLNKISLSSLRSINWGFLYTWGIPKVLSLHLITKLYRCFEVFQANIFA